MSAPYIWKWGDGKTHKLEVGDDVQIQIVPVHMTGFRMVGISKSRSVVWVEIMQISPGGWLAGRIDDNPNVQFGKTYGRAIRFNVSQIVDVYRTHY